MSSHLFPLFAIYRWSALNIKHKVAVFSVDFLNFFRMSIEILHGLQNERIAYHIYDACFWSKTKNMGLY